MDEKTIMALIGFLTLLTTNIFQYLKSKQSENKILDGIKASDKKQQKDIDYLKNKVTNVSDYTEKLKYSKNLINKIKIFADHVIDVNKIDNSELEAVLNGIKENYIIIVQNILDMPTNELNSESVKKEMKILARRLKYNTKFDKIDLNDPEDFCNMLKTEIALPSINTFAARLNGEILQDGNKFNGTFKRICFDVLEPMLVDTIKLYRDCKRT